MLYDKAKIHVQAGFGGSGCVSFRREAHVPRGGPDGGDGGRGGDVVLVCDTSLRDLKNFRHRSRFTAGRGGHGQGRLKHGAAGEDLQLRVPPGTEVQLEDGARYDLTAGDQRVVVAHGGSGGYGNKHFATPVRQTPRFAAKGLPGEEHWIELKLKLLADVGFVGLPNAGKSSLLSRLTNARPKVGNYPFTTLEPQLGTVEFDGRQLVLADIPGLIEGASGGAGLGHEFLAHIERTSLIVHLLDAAPVDGSDPETNYRTVEQELELHSPKLAELPRILALSKCDLLPPDRVVQLTEQWSGRLGFPVVATSSVTGQGLEVLVQRIFARVEQKPELPGGAVTPISANDAEVVAVADYMVFRPHGEREFIVEQLEEEGGFRVTGGKVERLVARFDMDNEEALAYVEGRLKTMGVLGALQEAGYEPGDTVQVGGVKLQLDIA